METEHPTLRLFRRLILIVALVGFSGALLDLFLLGHYENPTMGLPILFLSAALVSGTWLGLKPGSGALRAFKATMILLVLTGLLGMYLHFDGNKEFQVEMNPSIEAWALFNKVIRAHSPPALAPASLVQLALIGLLHCFRHPAAPARPVARNPAA